MTIPDDIVFGFGPGDLALNPVDDIEMYNFRELTPGTVFGHLRDDAHEPIWVSDVQGKSIFPEFIYIENRALWLRRHIMPAMLTRDGM